MILELLSWIAEAQMYSISRTRKDERLAFARLLGLTPRGPLPATGLVWASSGCLPGAVGSRSCRAAGHGGDAGSFRAAAVFHDRISRADDRTTEDRIHAVP